MKIITKFTDCQDTDFAKLSEEVENEFFALYGEKQKNYTVYNTLANIKEVILLYDGEIPFACAGFKEYGSKTVELKRVYVNKEYRGRGYSTYIIEQLIARAKEQGYETMILETGVKQKEALSLYKKLGFKITDNYGPYIGDDNSICMCINW